MDEKKARCGDNTAITIKKNELWLSYHLQISHNYEKKGVMAALSLHNSDLFGIFAPVRWRYKPNKIRKLWV